jgi:hypothetical protein
MIDRVVIMYMIVNLTYPHYFIDNMTLVAILRFVPVFRFSKVYVLCRIN